MPITKTFLLEYFVIPKIPPIFAPQSGNKAIAKQKCLT